MTAPLHERPSVPLTWAEQDRFELLMARMVCPGGRTRYDTRRARRRRTRRAARYGWLAGLLLAGLLCVALTYLQSLTPTTGAIR